jgi:hypothetical protein
MESQQSPTTLPKRVSRDMATRLATQAARKKLTSTTLIGFHILSALAGIASNL